MQRCSSVLPRLATQPLAKIPRATSTRAISDIAITRTGKPIIRQPGGGRSSIGGHTATVFGATGFTGRYIVNRLARSGCTVIVPFRDEYMKRHLKLCGDLGKVIFMEWDLRNTVSIEEAVRHSDIVINMVGKDHPTKNFSYADVHIEGTQRIAEAVAKYDCDRFIQISSFNADVNSPSEFFRTKGQGEVEARKIFPETTIVRPSPIYGPEDRFLFSLAAGSDFLHANHRRQKTFPIHVNDLGRALEVIAYDDNTASETFELFGPREYSKAQIVDLIEKMSLKSRKHYNLPKPVMMMIAKTLNTFIWWPTYSEDEVVREFIDQKIDPTAKTFKDLGIEPGELDQVAFQYMRNFRSDLYLDLPPMTEREKAEERKYHTVIQDM